MSLLQELLSLRDTRLSEEAIPVKPAEDVWKEGEELVKTYTPVTVYYVKELEGKNGVTQYEVYTEEGDKRKEYGTLDQEDLDAGFVELRRDQTPDAEGYIKYREIDDVQALKHEGDTIRVDLGSGEPVKLGDGDYLIQKTEDEDFVYYVEKARYFEANYSEKK